jgi:outer membrane immunogenic protein
MRRYLFVGLAAIAVSGVPGLALADKYQPKQAGPAAAMTTTSTNWTGGQFGGNGGGSSLAQNFADPGSFLCPSPGPCVETPFSFSDHPTKFTAGGFIGYRVQLGNIVIGIEGDLSGKSGESSYTQSGFAVGGASETFHGKVKQGWDGSVRGRIGTLLGPNVLLYTTAGVALSEISGSFSFNSVLGGDTVYGSKSWSDVKAGYTVGTGIEMRIVKGLTARVEYRYTDFGSQTTYVPLFNTGGGCGGVSVCGSLAKIDTDTAFHTVRLGIGFDF